MNTACTLIMVFYMIWNPGNYAVPDIAYTFISLPTQQKIDALKDNPIVIQIWQMNSWEERGQLLHSKRQQILNAMEKDK